ncbi:uncharacterized protein [Venturia canescens]|uniref:uncharacterized protein n=1 Tax=Venturia canescens TaxID=32260 RepID=UPI001C9BD6D5|nr:uncharacterized protein LOC122419307 [Venturia canescens]
MKRAIGIALFALVTIAVAHPSGSGEAPGNQLSQDGANQPPQLVDLINTAQENINNLGKQIQEQLNLPDQATVVNTIKTQSTNLVNNVQSYVAQVSEEIKAKSPELESLWTDIKAKLNKAVEDINAQIPNAQEQAAQLQAKFNEGVSVLVSESDKAAKAINQNSAKAQEDIAKFTKQAVEIAVQATQNLNAQLKKQASAAQAA